MSNDKQIAADLFNAATAFMAEARRQFSDEFAQVKVSGEARIDARVVDLAGARPRLELVVVDAAGERVMAHVDLERHDQPIGRPN